MAEKTLKTRIQLKYDTLANWNAVASTFVPKKGEVCFVEIPTGDLNATTAPTVLFKIGDGTTAWGSLKWGSALAADVYAWAKKVTPDYNDLTNKPTIPTVGNGTITINQAGSKKGSFTLNQSGNTTIDLVDTDTNTSYQLVLSGHTLKLQSKEKGASSWADVSGQSFTLPDNNTTYAFSSAATSGASFKVTPSGATAAQTVYIDGLGGAAFKAVGDFATAAQGTKADNAMPKSGGTFTGAITLAANPTADMHAATKKYVDSAISGVTQFDVAKYDSFDKLPATGKKGVIYLVPDTHSDSNDAYDEYIWNTAAQTPSYEKIGNTDVNLGGYYTKTEVDSKLNNKQNAITSGNKLSASLVSGLATVATSGSYNDLKDKPTIDNNNQRVSVGSTTFGANDVVDIVAGTNVSVSGDASKKTITINGKSDDGIKTLAEAQIKTHGGVDKTGTVTSVAAGTGLKITGAAATTPTINIDDSVTFVFDCGGAA